jgi:hypothetical protein
MENTMVSDESTNLVKLYDELLQKVESEQAAVALIQEIGKTQRARLLSARQNGNNGASHESPMTWKQRGLLQSLGVQIPVDCTRREASRLIDEDRAKTGR